MLNKSRIDHLWLDYHIRGKSLQHIDLVKIVDRFHNMSAERFFYKDGHFPEVSKTNLGLRDDEIVDRCACTNHSLPHFLTNKKNLIPKGRELCSRGTTQFY